MIFLQKILFCYVKIFMCFLYIGGKMVKRKKIEEIAKIWLQEKKNYIKASTVSAYATIIKNHINLFFGNKYSFEEKELQEFILQKIKR